MTTFQKFQTEIEKIHTRELSKQRVVEKEKVSAIRRSREDIKEVLISGAIRKTTGNPESTDYEHGPTHFENEDDFIDTIISSLTDDYNRASEHLIELLTRRRGEFILRIGLRPPRSVLFPSSTVDQTNKWTGVPKTSAEIEVLRTELTKAVEDIGGRVSLLYSCSTEHPRAAFLLRLPPSNVAVTPEVRCAVVGNVDSGKSTTLGVLTRGGLDDGRGRARIGLFRHKHEIESGRTSSVGMEILGFSTSGAPILPATTTSSDPDVFKREKLGWEQISKQAAKIVSFIDLAGHERYLKTTLYGLTSGSPSCVILMVGGNAGLIGMSKEHLAISLALSVPVVVCITKIDMTPPNILAETIVQINKILKSPGCRKTPIHVESLEVAVEVSQVFAKERLCPIFHISNVTGQGLDLLRAFLNLLPPSDDAKDFPIDQPLEFSITEVWSVPYVGTVVNGILNAGHIKAGDPILLGPDSNGGWQSTSVKSIQRKRTTVATADAGQCVSFALKRVRRAAVRKGMVIVSKSDTPPRAVRRFEGEVLILYHNTTLQKNYQAMLHCGAVRQTVRIVAMDHPQGVLRTGDRATVEFEFISHPEFIKEGMKLLFREGKTKGLGVITRLLS